MASVPDVGLLEDVTEATSSHHEHLLTLKRSSGLWLLSRATWSCSLCHRKSVLHPTLQRFTCSQGCHFDLCSICLSEESGAQHSEVGAVRAESSRGGSVLPRATPEAEAFNVVSVDGEQIDVLRRAEQTSQDESECAICYDELCSCQVSGLFRPDGKRCCRHFFHTSCLQLLSSSGVPRICPLCRTPFWETRPVPSPSEDPEGWFRAADIHGLGRLTRQEVGDALRAVLPINTSALECHFDVLWESWDKTGSGDIAMEEFLDPGGGLFSWVVETTKEVKKRYPQPPDLRTDRDGWFKFWDADQGGVLDKEQVMRALLKTFRDADVLQLRSIIGSMWMTFAGPTGANVSLEDFVRPGDGFLDTLMSNIAVQGEAVQKPRPQQQQHSSGNSAVGSLCACGKVHIHRGDRMKRGPAWPGGLEDGGEGELGSVVGDEESAGAVVVHWDISPPGEVHRYPWPEDQALQQVTHARFDEISEDVRSVQEAAGLSSAAGIELLRRAAAAGAVIEERRAAALASLREAGGFDEVSLRAPLKVFDRCRVLPEKLLVKQWFDACPPCPCSNSGCQGGVRWNPGAEKHLGREAYVVKVDPRDDTVFVEMTGRCNCKVWYPRLAVHPVFDPDTAEEPRFAVGTRVACRMDDGWAPGRIGRVRWRQPGWGNHRTAPYQVFLDDGRSVSAPRDDNETIRLGTPAAT